MLKDFNILHRPEGVLYISRRDRVWVVITSEDNIGCEKNSIYWV